MGCNYFVNQAHPKEYHLQQDTPSYMHTYRVCAKCAEWCEVKLTRPGTLYGKRRSKSQSIESKVKDSSGHSDKALYCYKSSYLTSHWGFGYEEVS